MSAKTSFKDGNILNATDLNGLGEAINQNEHNLVSVKSRLSTMENEIENINIIVSQIDFGNGYIVVNGDKYYPSNECATLSEIDTLFED